MSLTTMSNITIERHSELSAGQAAFVNNAAHDYTMKALVAEAMNRPSTGVIPSNRDIPSSGLNIT